MAKYNFVTIWKLRAPLPEVYDKIWDSLAWPHWWRGVERVEELKKGDERGVGGVRRYTWKSALPYRLTFDMEVVQVEEPRLIKGVASGELVGYGLWRLAQQGNTTIARYDWQVDTTKAWMNLLTPIARPLFAWNHDVVMRQGGEGLARLLVVELIENKNHVGRKSRSKIQSVTPSV
jgi:hypothetical protein